MLHKINSKQDGDIPQRASDTVFKIRLTVSLDFVYIEC
jgi:hypothetical protein